MQRKETPAEGALAGVRGPLALLVLTGLTAYVCWLLLRPFVSTLVWAVTLAIVARPLHDAIRRRLRREGLAAGLAVVLVALVVVVPALFVTRQVYAELAEHAGRIEQMVRSGEWRDWLESHPELASLASALERNGGQTASSLAGGIPTVLGVTMRGAVEAFLAMFALFFLFRDREPALRWLRRALPLRASESRRILRRLHDTVWATVYGTLVVAMMQGVLGGLMFWWLELPAPLLWGVVMGLLAIVPVLGAFVVWVPVAVWLALRGEWTDALILSVWGGIVIGWSDNLVYPALVGRRMRLHTLAVFVALLGGLVLMGAAGVVAGPAVLALGLELMRLWRRRAARHERQARRVRPGRLAPV